MIWIRLQKNLISTGLVTLILLLMFGLAISQLEQESLWNDEAWSMWAVRASLFDMLQRVALDVHPPLYFVLLDGWAALTGESAYAGRMLSAVVGVLGAAVVYALGKRLFDEWTGIIAMLLLGTGGFFIYYTREVRMYTLLLLVAALSMWAYVRWLRRPARNRLIIYGLSAAMLPYVHYYGALIALSQGIYLLLTQPRRLKGWVLACALALLLYIPWLLVLLQQVNTNPTGPLALPVPTNRATIRWLMLVLTGGAGILLFIPFLMGRALPRLREYGSAVLLLIVWLVVTPVVVLALNVWVAPLYQVRYVIAVLPAAALLAAYGLRHMWWRPVAILFVLALVINNLMTYGYFWPPKDPWQATITRSLLETRRPDEPLLMIIKRPYSLEAYYDRRLNLRRGNTLDLSNRQYSPAELQTIVSSLDDEPSVWVMMPNNIPETWITAAALDTHRHVGYRDNVAYMLFYRFDRGDSDNLTFSFGNKFRYEGRLFAEWPRVKKGVRQSPGDNTGNENLFRRSAVNRRRSVIRAERFCVGIALTALQPLDGSYSVGVHLVDESNRLAAQHDEGLGVRPAGEPIQLTPCLNIPPDTPPGHYPLHLVIYTWRDGHRLPVREGQQVFWGDSLVLGGITVE